MMDVIGFGAINLDEIYVVSSLAELPGSEMLSGSEQTIGRREYNRLTALMNQVDARQILSGGGQAANTLYALARLGFRTAIISSVGADPEGDSLLEGLTPVDTSQVLRAGRTARCIVIIEGGRERTMRVLPAAGVPRLNPLGAWQSLGGSRYLHLTSLAPLGRIGLQVEFVKSVSDATKLSFDPNELYCRLGPEALAPILKRVDVLFLNEREAEILTGRPAFQGCLDLLRREGAVLVCKKGSRGAAVVGRGGRFDVPAREVTAVDSTGAGDVFAAGFLAGLLLDFDLRRCALLGSEAAARSVGGYGRSSYPGPELLESLHMAPAEQRAKGGSA